MENGKTPLKPGAATHLEKLRSALEKGGKPGGKVMRVFNSLLNEESSNPLAAPRGSKK